MYLDESGCSGCLPTPPGKIQPVFILAGLIINHEHLKSVNRDFLALKTKYARNPTLTHYQDIMLSEMKGADLRKDLIKPNRNNRRRAKRLLQEVIGILVKYDIKLIAKIHVKKPGGTFSSKGMYTSTVQYLYKTFNAFLQEKQDIGMVIADSRNPALNANVSHSIFTQKNKLGTNGDAYPNIIEVPLFGHSENHSLIQIADLICSALLFPMSSYTYCTNHFVSDHIKPGYKQVLLDFIDDIKILCYRYKNNGRYRGGIVVVDYISQKSSADMINKRNLP